MRRKGCWETVSTKDLPRYRPTVWGWDPFEYSTWLGSTKCHPPRPAEMQGAEAAPDKEGSEKDSDDDFEADDGLVTDFLIVPLVQSTPGLVANDLCTSPSPPRPGRIPRRAWD